MRLEIGTNNQVEAVAIVMPVETRRDAALNDSNKSWVVPDGEMWKILWAHVRYTSSADVGNRQMTFLIKDADGNEIFDIAAGIVQAAGLTRHYNFAQGVYRETAFAADELQTPIPVDCYLPAGYTLQFYDSAAVAVAADDMIVNFAIQRFKGAA